MFNGIELHCSRSVVVVGATSSLFHGPCPLPTVVQLREKVVKTSLGLMVRKFNFHCLTTFSFEVLANPEPLCTHRLARWDSRHETELCQRVVVVGEFEWCQELFQIVVPSAGRLLLCGRGNMPGEVARKARAPSWSYSRCCIRKSRSSTSVHPYNVSLVGIWHQHNFGLHIARGTVDEK